jgi:hypothetical protein
VVNVLQNLALRSGVLHLATGGERREQPPQVLKGNPKIYTSIHSICKYPQHHKELHRPIHRGPNLISLNDGILLEDLHGINLPQRR